MVRKSHTTVDATCHAAMAMIGSGPSLRARVMRTGAVSMSIVLAVRGKWNLASCDRVRLLLVL